jgi:hypothetical protein
LTYDVYDWLRCLLHRNAMRVCPSRGGDVLDLPVGEVRQSGQHVTQVGVRLNAAAAAAAQEGVEHGTAVTSIHVTDEEPILFVRQISA